MASPPTYDVVILGGGLAGLSLAMRLVEVPACRTLVIEPRTSYRRDRTWSYWPLAPHPFGPAVATRWPAWEVLRAGRDGRVRRAVQTCAALPYGTIPADRLYGQAEAAIAAAPHIELRRGVAATGVGETGDRVVVETAPAGPRPPGRPADAASVEASWVFDGRPPPVAASGLVQRFLGQEVRADRPVFDPGTATLMDFTVEQVPGVVHFLYVLPASATEALVEDTWLAPASAALPDSRETIRRYLARRYGVDAFETGFEEEGAIPMDPGLQAPEGAGRVIPIGTAGGAVKPSSGYGFLAIQRMADALAADLASGRPPRPFQPRSPLARRLDSVFLTALERTPEAAPAIFHSLFARCRPEPLLRFLNDVGTVRDVAEVIAATPKVVMLAAAWHALRARGA